MKTEFMNLENVKTINKVGKYDKIGGKIDLKNLKRCSDVSIEILDKNP